MSTSPHPSQDTSPNISPPAPPDRPASNTRPHTAASAALLLMASAVLSGLLGLVRIKVINSIWGAGPEQDAYQAAFKLPDLLAYFLIGGAASISLITILNRYREAGDDEGGDRALSVILTTMFLVLGAGVLLAEIFAPQYVLLANKGFRVHPQAAALCIRMTRIILPAQLFFFLGSVMGSYLQVRRIFLYQAFAPLIYNAGIILGALLLHTRIDAASPGNGVTSLAFGVLAGMFAGYGLLNTFGALRHGLRFRPALGFRHPAFLEWLKLSLPLMIGVSLVMFDGIFLNYYGSTREGGITLISNAKALFNAPFNVIGPAAGAASLPFFASLFQQGRAADFSRSVARSVSRLFAVGMLVSAWMIALAPWLMDLFRGGRFHRTDAAGTTQLFVLFAVTLAIWAVQGIYARAFYAASDTRTPAITGTLVTLLSVPVYAALFHGFGLRGLAIASDVGILAQTAALALLLDRKRLVSLADLEFPELARAALAAALAFGATSAATHVLPAVSTHARDAVTIVAATALWAGVAGITLVATGSALPRQILRRGTR